MSSYKRIFLIGHPGAGKALVSKNLAEKLGWKFIDADLGLESRVGTTIHDILGQLHIIRLPNCKTCTKPLIVFVKSKKVG